MKKVFIITVTIVALFFNINVYAAYAAKIGDSSYNTLADAIQAVGEEATITVTDNINLTDKVTIPAGKKVVLDLNGKTIKVPTVENNYGVVIKGDLQIKGKGTVTVGQFGIGVSPGGKLTIESGTYNCPTGDYLIGSWGTVEIKGGTFNGNYCIANGFDNGTVKITDGVYNSKEATIVLGNVTIEGGSFNHNVTEYLAQRVKQVKYNGVYYVGNIYNITVETVKNGKLVVPKEAVDGQPVKMDITPNKGYEIDTLGVIDKDKNNIEVKNNEFMMPESDVSIKATFKLETLDKTHQT